MKKLLVPVLVVVLGFCAIMTAGFLVAGCETGGDTVALTVSPSFVDLTTSSNGVSSTSNTVTQTFTVETNGLRLLSLPLEWSVSNPQLGRIGASGGYSASYVRTDAHGDNAIAVVDQYGARGVATVRQ
jgi:hypothetical protein